MTRPIAGCILIAATLATLYAATVRPRNHPLLITAQMDWCSYRPGGPLIDKPRNNYDYRTGKRRTGGHA